VPRQAEQLLAALVQHPIELHLVLHHLRPELPDHEPIPTPALRVDRLPPHALRRIAELLRPVHPLRLRQRQRSLDPAAVDERPSPAADGLFACHAGQVNPAAVRSSDIDAFHGRRSTRIFERRRMTCWSGLAGKEITANAEQLP
jgi:hypothetical protein